MRAQHVTDCLCIGIDTVDSRDEISAVALQENAVFGPVVVFIVLFPGAFEESVVFHFWVEHKAVTCQLILVANRSLLVLTLHP